MKRFDIMAMPDSDAKTLMTEIYQAFARKFPIPGQSTEATAAGFRELHERGIIDVLDNGEGFSFRLTEMGAGPPPSRRDRRALRKRLRQ